MATNRSQPVERTLFESIEERSVPETDQSTIRVSKDRREQMKLISALSRPRKTAFELVDAVMTAFIRRFEAASGLSILNSPVTQGAIETLRTRDPADIGECVVPLDEQTTLKVTKDVREALRVISAYEGKTIFAMTDAVLLDFVEQFDAASGYSLMSRYRR